MSAELSDQGEPNAVAALPPEELARVLGLLEATSALTHDLRLILGEPDANKLVDGTLRDEVHTPGA